MFLGIKIFYRHAHLIVLMPAIYFITFVGCVENNIECSRFREGHFYLKSETSKEEYRVDRFKNTQIETVLSSGIKSLWNVSWIDNCTYRVKYMHDINDSSSTDPVRITLPTLVFKIIETGQTYYVFECSVDSLRILAKDTVWIR